MSIIPVASPASTRVAASVGVELILNHYQGVDLVAWHAQIQLAAASDALFASPIVDVNSATSQTGWYWRNEQLNSTDLGLVAVPAGGMVTSLAQIRGYGRVGTAIYFLQEVDLEELSAGQILLVRGRQSADGGTSWGDWAFLGQVIVGG